jgi:Spy/CpxP family protein refolding chaperone
MSRRFLSMALVLSLALNLSAVAALLVFRWGPPARAHLGQPGTPPQVSMAALALTPEQTSKVAAIQEAFPQEALPLRQSIQAKNAELAEAAMAAVPDPARTAHLLDEAAALHRAMQELAFRRLNEEAQFLTAAQREQFAGMLQGYLCAGLCPAAPAPEPGETATGPRQPQAAP